VLIHLWRLAGEFLYCSLPFKLLKLMLLNLIMSVLLSSTYCFISIHT